MKHDFTVDEEMVIDRDAAQYPKTPDEPAIGGASGSSTTCWCLKADDARRPTTNRTATTTAPSRRQKSRRKRLSRRYHSFAKRMHQTDSKELLEMYLTSLTTLLRSAHHLHVAATRWRTSRS